MENNNLKYIILKLSLIFTLIYLFFKPEWFSKGDGLLIESVVVCRGMSLLLAIYIISRLVDTIYKK